MFKKYNRGIYCASLLESKSKIALTRLNSISDKIFASNISMFLGVPVTVKTKRKWFMYDGSNDKDYGDTRWAVICK